MQVVEKSKLSTIYAGRNCQRTERITESRNLQVCRNGTVWVGLETATKDKKVAKNLAVIVPCCAFLTMVFVPPSESACRLQFQGERISL